MYLDDREGAALCPTTEEQEEFVESFFSDRDKLTNELKIRRDTFYTFRFIPLSVFERLGYPVTVLLDRLNVRFAFEKAKSEYLDRFSPEEPVLVFKRAEHHPIYEDPSYFYYCTL